jgi:CheY-like chemotaxis protein
MKSILIADDNLAGREMVRAALESCGYRVFEAADGREALQEARQTRPDLIILDLAMPFLDGFGVLAELRQSAEFASTPIIALTASAMQGDRGRAILAGFTGYLTKPVRLSELRDEIARLLNVSLQAAAASGRA